MLSGVAPRRGAVMPRTRPPYAPEFRLEAAGSGRSRRAPGRAQNGGAGAAARARARKQGAASGAGDLEAGRGFLCQGDRSTVTRFRFVEAERSEFPVSLLCRVVGVT